MGRRLVIGGGVLERALRALARRLLRRLGLYRARPMEMSSLSNPPAPKTEAEKKILGVINGIAKARTAPFSVPIADGRMLRILTEAAGARNVVEIGTSVGYSGLWLCLALETAGGRLTTFEIDSDRSSLAREHFARAGVDHMVSVIEGNAHDNLACLEEPIDVLFIDADKPGYMDYLEKLLPLVRPGGLILAHNVARVPAYAKAVSTNPDLETVFYMEGSGLGITLKKR